LRRLEKDDALTVLGAGGAMVPAMEPDATRRQIRGPKRLLGEKPLENRNPEGDAVYDGV
jgi:hypothetical protein